MLCIRPCVPYNQTVIISGPVHTFSCFLFVAAQAGHGIRFCIDRGPYCLQHHPLRCTVINKCYCFISWGYWISLFKIPNFVYLCLFITCRNLLLGASSSFSFEIFWWLARDAQGLFHFPYKECRHAWLFAVYFWISGLYFCQNPCPVIF